MNNNLNNTKTCPNCGVTNLANAKFCIKCGANLKDNNMENENMNNNSNDNMNNNYNNTFDNNQNNMDQMNNNFNNNYNNNNNNWNNNSNNIGNNNWNNNQMYSGKLDYFKYIISAFLKPFDTFKNNENSMNDIKNVSILAVITVGIMTVINLLSTMISAVRRVSIFSGVTWNWSNLKDVEYFKVIGLDLLIYAGIIAGIAGVYYLASLVIKKEAKFAKLLGAVTTAAIPLTVCSLLLSPLLSMLYAPLGIAAAIVGGIYCVVTLFELINDIVVIENKNSRIYYHLICLSVVVIVGGFIAYKVLMGSLLGGGLDDFLDF